MRKSQTKTNTPTPSDLIKNFGVPRSVMLPLLCCCLGQGVACRDVGANPANQMRSLPDNLPNRATHLLGWGAVQDAVVFTWSK